MNFLYKILGYFITIPLFICWLLFSFVLSLIGLFLYERRIHIDLEKVKKRDTICSVLNSKKLLSDDEYAFETEDVALLYDELTFRGYLFVLSPVIFLLKHFSFTDSFVLYLVKKWMYIHKYLRQHEKRPKSFFSALMSLCVFLAFLLGQVLYRLKP